MSNVFIAFQKTEETRGIIEAILEDNPNAIVNEQPAMVKIDAADSMTIKRATIEEKMGRSFDLQEMQIYDRGLVNDELAQLRYQASIRPGFQESFAAMFPAPRQRWVDAMASAEADIRAIRHETLVIHGRDDQIIPLANSLTLARWIDRSQLHVFGRCGHWTQIEHAARFARLLIDFFAEEN